MPFKERTTSLDLKLQIFKDAISEDVLSSVPLNEANFTGADLRGVDLNGDHASGAFAEGLIGRYESTETHKENMQGLDYIERVVSAETPTKKDLSRVFNNLEKYMSREDYMLFYGERIEGLFLKSLEKSRIQKFKYNFRSS